MSDRKSFVSGTKLRAARIRTLDLALTMVIASHVAGHGMERETNKVVDEHGMFLRT